MKKKEQICKNCNHSKSCHLPDFKVGKVGSYCEYLGCDCFKFDAFEDLNETGDKK